MSNELHARGRGTALEDERCENRITTASEGDEPAGYAQEGAMQHLTAKPSARGPIGSFAARVLRGEVPPPPIARTLKIDLVSVSPGHAVAEHEVSLARFANPMGSLHGGILCDLADLARGVAYGGTLQDDETFTTVELTMNFLRPVFQGKLTATAQLVHSGRSLGLIACDVTDARGRLVARAKSTCMTLRGEQAAGR